MGKIAGFVCNSCNYKRTYYLGVGFNLGKELKLYVCNNCKNLRSSKLNNPKCRKCYNSDLTLIKDFSKLFLCPKCNTKKFTQEFGGLWD